MNAFDVESNAVDASQRGTLSSGRFGCGLDIQRCRRFALVLEAVRQYVEATGDLSLFRRLYPALQQIVRCYREGSRYNIHFDTAEGNAERSYCYDVIAP